MLSKELISDANLKYSSQYRGELASHLPMALVALERIGADLDRLRNFTDHYSKRLEPRPESVGLHLTSSNWQNYLGQNKYHIDYFDYFKERLNTLGLENLLETHLPSLFSGVAGGAFHGLIRLGYAIDSHNDEEIPEALSYWAISWLNLGAEGLSRDSETLNLTELFDRLHVEFDGFRPAAPNIARRMELVSRLEKFRQICGGIEQKSITYENMAPLVLSLFHQSQDFTALHAVTATHAFRIFSTYCPNLKSVAFDLLVGISAAYVTIKSPKINVGVRAEMKCTWKTLKDLALKSNDDHVPKIVYSCFEEFCENNNALYFEAAHRYVVKICGQA